MESEGVAIGSTFFLYVNVQYLHFLSMKQKENENADIRC